MTYNEWRDELKQNLFSVSEDERKRVFDYYAEAYADRREAGFSEEEIIRGFGAPYDAAQRILGASTDEERIKRRRQENFAGQNGFPRNDSYAYAPQPPPQPAPVYAPAPKKSHTWVFVLLCILLCVPLFGLIMTMLGVTVGFFCAPIGVLGSGIALIVDSFLNMARGDINYGFCLLGGGVILTGLSIVLFPLFIKLIKLMWKLFNMFFCWLKSLFGGKERA